MNKKLNIKFIGTGSGKTSLKRFHSSVIFSDSDYNLLVDAGDGISKALLVQNIPYNSINGILFTHLHPDHFSGFASLIVQMKMSKRKEPLSVFVHHTLVKTLMDFLHSSYIFKDRLDFSFEYKGFDFGKEISVYSGLSFISRQNTHFREHERIDPSLSYACGSFIFKTGSKNIYYSGDVGSADDLFLFKDFRINILITESTHVNINEILNISDKLNPDKIVLTHLGDEDLSGSISKIKKIKDDLLIAEDGLILSV